MMREVASSLLANISIGGKAVARLSEERPRRFYSVLSTDMKVLWLGNARRIGVVELAALISPPHTDDHLAVIY